MFSQLNFHFCSFKLHFTLRGISKLQVFKLISYCFSTLNKLLFKYFPTSLSRSSSVCASWFANLKLEAIQVGIWVFAKGNFKLKCCLMHSGRVAFKRCTATAKYWWIENTAFPGAGLLHLQTFYTNLKIFLFSAATRR